MTRRLGSQRWGALLVVVLAVACVPPRGAQPSDLAHTRSTWTPILSKTRGAEALPGFMPLSWDAHEGKLWMQIADWDRELLYVTSLPSGIGSNDIGLDRGQLGAARVVRFERRGPKVLLIQSNYDYRGEGGSADEQRAVRQSFAESVLWGFDVEAETKGDVLVDATAFFLRDAHDVPLALRRAGQGKYVLDPKRSAFAFERTKGFPNNTEVETTLTFAIDDPTSEPGAWVRQVVPTPQAISVREHHSLIALPAKPYARRAYDPRAGFFDVSYQDYALPLDRSSIVQRWTVRHRLEPKDPSTASKPVRPIVYYVDRAAPEPIRAALLDGARWWTAAFAAAGFQDAFRVELLPEGVDPMDIRYNVIQWVHRATRGWSYGSTVVDPRSGEILKGHVTLGSLRVRQDMRIAEALLAPYAKDATGRAAQVQALALARLRQLAAHEVGHTLGLMHNFAASTVDRASVMDYPAPLLTVAADGAIDPSSAYATGIGAWDKTAIAWGYHHAAAPDAGDRILRDAWAAGQRYLSDDDARPAGSSSSVAHLWDLGGNAIDELARIMKLRAAALARFGEATIPAGAPMATLEDALVPLYLLHRYQVEAATKLIGGVDYVFALRGDGQPAPQPIAPAEQRRALAAVLATLSPDALTLPEAILALIPPRPPSYPRGREHFKLRTSPAFDALAPAEAAAHHVVGILLAPERAARLIEQHARVPASPSLDDVLDALLAATWRARRPAGLAAEVARTVDQVVLLHVFALAYHERSSPQTRAIAMQTVLGLQRWLATATSPDAAERAHLAYGAQQIADVLREAPRRQLPFDLAPSPPPDGPPIGSLGTSFGDE